MRIFIELFLTILATQGVDIKYFSSTDPPTAKNYLNAFFGMKFGNNYSKLISISKILKKTQKCNSILNQCFSVFNFLPKNCFFFEKCFKLLIGIGSYDKNLVLSYSFLINDLLLHWLIVPAPIYE